MMLAVYLTARVLPDYSINYLIEKYRAVDCGERGLKGRARAALQNIISVCVITISAAMACTYVEFNYYRIWFWETNRSQEI